MGPARRSMTALASALVVASAGQAVAAGPAAAAECLVPADQWQIVDLGVAGAASDINDQGQIAGWTRLPNGDTRAVLWDGGQVVDVGTLGGPKASASAIDEDARVVGHSYTADSKGNAFVWHDGTMLDLGTFGGYAAFPKDVSQGVVVGEYGTLLSSGSRRSTAFVVRDGVKSDLGGVVAGSGATDINAAGQIAGTHRRTETLGLPADQQTQRAFLWEDGVVTELGTLGGGWSQSSGLNGHGQVVGQSALGADGVLQGGFVWSRESGMRRVEDGGGLARPTAVNDDGLIVGTHSCDATGGAARPAAWTDPAQPPVRLPDPPGGTATIVNAVNVHGEIVGAATYPDGRQHAVLWKPQP